ncbi:hypothetical protein O7635_29135 [Asanoa sp. WMMD1127]|uniref:hypothetical protein n=1 Tax=Asanoa sp. WMMD1127 TaxID=3016107 RepID=UPI00241710D1|nr:hypothetical protein [Asanoa sp. WMMD1127]MDG4825932.1 hypothetical protein [Asanoa sp. WMMD1127]
MTETQRYALAGMSVVERDLVARADARQLRRVARGRVLEQQPAGTPPAGEAGQRRLARLREFHGGTVERARAPRPAPVALGTVATPPYEFEWTWSHAVNDTRVDALTAARADGACELTGIATGETGDATLSLRAAVGLAVRPGVDGLLTLAAAPALSWRWMTLVNLQDGASAGFTGFVVQRFRVADNAFEGTEVQQIGPYLWSENSWWGGANGEATTDAHPLAATIPVSAAHWYAVWVWCGTIADAGHDFGIFWWASARSSLALRLPYVAWNVA